MRRTLFRRGWVVAAAALAGMACFSSTEPDDFYGTWVGDGVELTLLETLAHFETSCWTGDLAMPIIVDDDRFTAPATLNSRGGAGMSETRLVEFRGRLDGGRLSLTITPQTPGLGPYELQRGIPPELPACPVPGI